MLLKLVKGRYAHFNRRNGDFECQGNKKCLTNLRQNTRHQQLQLVLQTGDHQAHHPFIELRRVLGVDIVFFYCKLPNNHPFEGIAKLLIFMYRIFDISQLLVSWNVKKYTLVFGSIIDKSGKE